MSTFRISTLQDREHVRTQVLYYRDNSPGDRKTEDEHIALCLAGGKFPFPPYGPLEQFQLADFRRLRGEKWITRQRQIAATSSTCP